MAYPPGLGSTSIHGRKHGSVKYTPTSSNWRMEK
jgi:hypothetical protein